MIAQRQNFQRVYDLRECVFPSWDDRQILSIAEVRRESSLKAVRAWDVTTARWVHNYFRTGKRETLETVSALAREGALLTVKVEG